MKKLTLVIIGLMIGVLFGDWIITKKELKELKKEYLLHKQVISFFENGYERRKAGEVVEVVRAEFQPPLPYIEFHEHGRVKKFGSDQIKIVKITSVVKYSPEVERAMVIPHDCVVLTTNTLEFYTLEKDGKLTLYRFFDDRQIKVVDNKIVFRLKPLPSKWETRATKVEQIR